MEQLKDQVRKTLDRYLPTVEAPEGKHIPAGGQYVNGIWPLAGDLDAIIDEAFKAGEKKGVASQQAKIDYLLNELTAKKS